MTSSRGYHGHQVRLFAVFTLLKHLGFVHGSLTNEIVGNLRLEYCTEGTCPTPYNSHRPNDAMSQQLWPLLQKWHKNSTSTFLINAPTTDNGRAYNRTVFTVRHQCIRHNNGDFTCSLCQNFCPMFVNVEFISLPDTPVRYSTTVNNTMLHNNIRTINSKAQVLVKFGDTSMRDKTPTNFKLKCSGNRACLHPQLEISAVAYMCDSNRS